MRATIQTQFPPYLPNLTKSPPPPPPPPLAAAPPPARRFLFAIPAYSRRRIVNPPSSSSSSSSPNQQRRNQKRQQEQGAEEEEEEGKGRDEMRGSDFLLAWQRATVHKRKTRKSLLTGPGKETRDNNGDGGDSGNEDAAAAAAASAPDYSKVRPLNVKSDWETRLEQLEKRIRQFTGRNLKF
ncbi:hypothetical protein Dimus_025395 [Dionaea muscipula]